MPTVLPVVYTCRRIEVGAPATSLLMSEWFLSPKMTSPPSTYTMADFVGSPVMVKVWEFAQKDEKQYGVSLAAMLVPTNGCSGPAALQTLSWVVMKPVPDVASCSGSGSPTVEVLAAAGQPWPVQCAAFGLFAQSYSVMPSTVVELPLRVRLPLVPTTPSPVVGYDTAALLPLKFTLELANAARLKSGDCVTCA